MPIGGLGPVLREIAEWNPISTQAGAVRTLFGDPTGMSSDAAWPMQHPVLRAVRWSLLIVVICLPLALRRFRQRTTA